MQEYIIQKKELYQQLFLFIDDENDDDDYYVDLINFLIKQKITESTSEMKLFIRLLINISCDLHRIPNLHKKIEKIFLFLKSNINKMLSNVEIFEIAIDNKLILLFLLENNILTIDSNITYMILSMIHKNSMPYYYFFFPEIKQFVGSEKLKIIEKELLKYDSNIFINFEEKRRKGENEAYICSLIRNDSIKEFINYVEKNDIQLSSTIKPSPFETNLFLLKSNPTLIQYASFYGSIEIFKYLKSKNIKLSPSLWLYAIHSNCTKLIGILEKNKVKPPNNSYEKCFCELIKYHHNDIAQYILINKLSNISESKYSEKTLKCIMKYHNYQYFPDDFIRNNYIFYALFDYGYLKLVEPYLEPMSELIIQNKILFSIVIIFKQKPLMLFLFCHKFHEIIYICLNDISCFIFQFNY